MQDRHHAVAVAITAERAGRPKPCGPCKYCLRTRKVKCRRSPPPRFAIRRNTPGLVCGTNPRQEDSSHPAVLAALTPQMRVFCFASAKAHGGECVARRRPNSEHAAKRLRVTMERVWDGAASRGCNALHGSRTDERGNRQWTPTDVEERSRNRLRTHHKHQPETPARNRTCRAKRRTVLRVPHNAVSSLMRYAACKDRRRNRWGTVPLRSATVVSSPVLTALES
jgi:hypothetical protein